MRKFCKTCQTVLMLCKCPKPPKEPKGNAFLSQKWFSERSQEPDPKEWATKVAEVITPKALADYLLSRGFTLEDTWQRKDLPGKEFRQYGYPGDPTCCEWFCYSHRLVDAERSFSQILLSLAFYEKRSWLAVANDILFPKDKTDV